MLKNKTAKQRQRERKWWIGVCIVCLHVFMFITVIRKLTFVAMFFQTIKSCTWKKNRKNLYLNRKFTPVFFKDFHYAEWTLIFVQAFSMTFYDFFISCNSIVKTISLLLGHLINFLFWRFVFVLLFFSFQLTFILVYNFTKKIP